MDDFSTKIQNKKVKVENALSELNNEIVTCLNFLQCLKSHSAEIVGDLNSIITPAIYFKEFVDVNSFILKYLSFLTEVNCRFEMLEINENKHNLSISTSDSTGTSEILSGVPDVLDVVFDSCKPLPNIEYAEDIKEYPTELDESFLTNAKNPKKNIRKESHVPSEIETIKNSNNNNSQLTNAKIKSNLQTNPDNLAYSGTNFSQDVKTDNHKLAAKKAEKTICKSSNKEVSPPQINCITHTNDGKLQTVDGKSSQVIDSANTSMCNEVQIQESRINFPNVDIPVAEVMPRKINCNYNSETVEAINGLQKISKRTFNYPNQGNPEEKINEDDIKPIEISRKVGNEYKIMIENIQSPSEFYVNIKDAQADLFLELLQKLKLIYGVKRKVWNKSEESKKVWLSKHLGSYALFYSKCDELWCRAKVINWYLNLKDYFVKIFLLDYGEYKCVSIDDLESMPEYFKKFPAFVRRCHLYGISPSDIDMDNETLSWGKESTAEMKSLTETSKILKIRIAPADDFHPAASLPVWLLDQNDECINELLVKSKWAVYSSQLCSTSMKTGAKDEVATENENLKNWNPMREDFEAYENSYDLDIDDPAMYIYGYVGKDYERVCRHFAKTGYCFKGAACKKEHKKLDHLGFTTDQEEIYKNAFNNLSVPPLNSVVRVQVTCLLGINNFCCILEDRKQHPEDENLQTLLNFMNRTENIQEMKKLLIPPSAGQIVIAQYSQDHSWYRAKILESQPENDIYSVLYVDYGNKETVSLLHIRAIEARYLHLPFQAVHCYIFGIAQNPTVPIKSTMSYLNKKISSGQISIEIISKLPGEGVTFLVHMFDQNGENVGADLLGKNFAIHKEEMIISCNSETMPG